MIADVAEPLHRDPLSLPAAGTLIPGPMKFLRTSSAVKRRVIFSRWATSYLRGSNDTPPFEPPNGTSIKAVFQVIQPARARISSAVTSG